MATVKIYEIFNNRLIDFLKDLDGVLGHVADYKTLVTSAKFLARFPDTEKKNAQIFIQYISTPYRKEIMARNDSFFISREFKEANDANAGDIVQLLKGVWQNLVNEDRDAIWGHLNTLLTIADRIEKK